MNGKCSICINFFPAHFWDTWFANALPLIFDISGHLASRRINQKLPCGLATKGAAFAN
jgi:hypothetical protein